MAEHSKKPDEAARAAEPPGAEPAGAEPAAKAEATRFAVQPQLGEVITTSVTKNTYTIGEKIGEGAFGIVYGCRDGWNNDLAVKVLKPVGTYDKVREGAAGEFVRLMHLRHPNITFVYDAFEHRDTFYIVTERCHGSLTTTLFALEDFNGLLWLMPVARCLLQAVGYLHQNNYVHQDIHLGNIFSAFVKDEMVPAEVGVIKFKLGDLGVSRLATEINAKNTRARWMLPPEVLNPTEYGPLDHRLDIYHSGLILLQFAYSRELKFSEQEVLDGKPREMALALPAPYRVALEKALRRHAQYRTASAAELWRDLQSPPEPAEESTRGLSQQSTRVD
jgi:eukaryotic-like serine/threonine-protein kinase